MNKINHFFYSLLILFSLIIALFLNQTILTLAASIQLSNSLSRGLFHLLLQPSPASGVSTIDHIGYEPCQMYPSFDCRLQHPFANPDFVANLTLLGMTAFLRRLLTVV